MYSPSASPVIVCGSVVVTNCSITLPVLSLTTNVAPLRGLPVSLSTFKIFTNFSIGLFSIVITALLLVSLIVNSKISSVFSYPAGASISSTVYLPSARFSIICDSVVVVKVSITSPSLFFTTSVAPATGSLVILSIFIISAVFSIASFSILIVAELLVSLIVNSKISSVFLYPAGAFSSSTVYLPSARFFRTWASSVVVNLSTTLPLLFFTTSTAPATAFPVSLSTFIIVALFSIGVFSIVIVAWLLVSLIVKVKISSVFLYPAGAFSSSTVYLPSARFFKACALLLL